MNREHFPGGAIYEESIITVDENGEEVHVPLSQIPELQSEPYNWGDAMVVTFDDNEGDE